MPMSQLPPTEIKPTNDSRVDVLVTVDHGRGTAAIVRDTHEDGALWLVCTPDEAATELHGYLPAMEPLGGEALVQGGRLPAPAVGAEVVDELGRRWPAAAADGAWLVVVDQPIAFGVGLPVRFLDAAGETVRRPLPASWPRTPVHDAPEPCPACAGTGWDHVRPRDPARRPAPGSVVCRHCGHEEAIGDALAAPAAGAPEREPRGPFVVASRIEDDVTALSHLVRMSLGDALRDETPWPARTPAGLAVWLRSRERELRRIAARAPLSTRALSVDGGEADFCFASAGQAWAAARRHGDVTIVVTAAGVRPEDVSLEPS